MSDISLIITSGLSVGGPSFDALIQNGDLATDDGLQTAIILSLCLDRRAADDDELPDPDDTDRRGWWGDLPLEEGDEPDPIGSRLWLLERAKDTPETAVQAKHYIAEALQWMIDDGVARAITIETQWKSLGFLAIGLSITKADSSGSADSRYDLIWKATV